MSEAALHQHRFEAIEAYLIGTMPAPERERFEVEMAHDLRLKAEVDLQRENMLAVELGGLRQNMQAIMQEDSLHTGGQAPAERSSSPSWTGYLKYAAAIALLVTVSVWWFARPSANERLFAAHFTADPGLPVPMSITNDPVFHDAMVAYKLGDYHEARTKWAVLLADRPANDTLRYYMGSAALAGGSAAGAVPLLQAVASDSTSAFSGKARWYLFLSYLRTGDTAGMAAIGLDDDPVYGERVRAIKMDMK